MPDLKADLVIALVPSEGGYEVVVDNPKGIPDEIVAAALNDAADNIMGVHDRARNCW